MTETALQIGFTTTRHENSVRGDTAVTLEKTIGAVMVLCALCTGCVAVAVEGANITKDEVIYQRNIAEAEKGDAVAQYKVGEALCCSLNEGSAFYNTKKSVEWLCKSARQGHAPAMYKVGKILSGDVIDGIRLSRRLAQGLAGTSTNTPLAYGWFRAAEKNGAGDMVADAKERAEGLWEDLSEEDRAAATTIANAPLPEACTWAEAGLEKS